MKIQQNTVVGSDAPEVRSRQDSSSASGARVNGGSLVSDQISIGRQQQLLNFAMNDGPHSARVNELAQLYTSGKYNPDPAAIADSIVREALGE
jgi:anti-sigma28 factor (negative regulator of flagellin synthesis)